MELRAGRTLFVARTSVAIAAVSLSTVGPIEAEGPPQHISSWPVDGPSHRLAPRGLSVGNGTAYVAGVFTRYIYVFTQEGALIDKWGGPDSELWAPSDVAIADDGHVVISDWTRRIEVRDPAGALIDSWFIPEDDPHSLPPEATGIALGPNGLIYVCDRLTASIHVYSTTGERMTRWWLGRDGVGSPHGIATSATGDVYIATPRRIHKYSANGSLITSWGDQGDGEGHFEGATGLGIDADGNVWVADTGNNRVQIFNSEGAFFQAWGEHGTGPGQFDGPTDVAVDQEGRIYVSDTGNTRVQVFEHATGVESTSWTLLKRFYR